ncbi:hypothetical protein [Paractinoplanes rishiriensis]|uniref:Gfo/Idh/MocA-like oxidoreductase N-terminal domain-containing protein n=1 Tax=Paractinoplanes rishiriensis TaxID=1050105 RepID=A0A919MY59_9ACTN|nr:hypothetical protein [Actinoplanes rishiriensis]GIE99773.1 hypothetical protein Ari01nite_72380 [Actinoplanes rishiriensis]
MSPTVALVSTPHRSFPGWRTAAVTAGRAAEMVRAGAVDAVVAGPGDQVPELIWSALSHGVPICCDPPLAPTAAEAGEIAAAARAATAPAVVSFPWRSQGALADARDTIRSGRLGDLLTVDLTVHDDPRATSAGVAAIHQLDLLRWLTRPDWTVEAGWSATVPLDGWGLGLTTVGLCAGDTRARIAASRLDRGAPRFQLTATGVHGTLLVVMDPRDGAGMWRLSLASGTGERVFGGGEVDPHLSFLLADEGGFFDDAAQAHSLAAAAETTRLAGAAAR